MQKWSAEKANQWWAEQDWVCGFNFLPSTAVNFLEMWMGDTFDRETIARELKWAADAGFNSVRTNPHYLVWLNDRDGLIERLRWFMETAQDLGISTMPTLFDDCGFGGFEPEYGPQPQPVPNTHNSRAVASPGRANLMDRDNWPGFEAYVKDVISTFSDHPAVLLWDLYNEPGNRSVFGANGAHQQYDPAMTPFSTALMVDCFKWAREVGPAAPLSVGAWRLDPDGDPDADYDNEIDRIALEQSDVVTFHAYVNRERAEGIVERLERHGRPMLSTEWMARSIGSKFLDQLDLYARRKIGCYNWGMVQGRTQTNLPWPHMIDQATTELDGEPTWFHDVYRTGGEPYDPTEIELIRRLTSAG